MDNTSELPIAPAIAPVPADLIESVKELWLIRQTKLAYTAIDELASWRFLNIPSEYAPPLPPPPPPQPRNELHRERLQEMIALRLSNHTLQEIGDRFGITREAVRQQLKRWGPSDLAERKQGVADQQKTATLFEQRASTATVCVTCEYWVLRGSKYKTCSEECARLYFAVRRYLDPKHRFDQGQAMARLRLRKNPDDIWAKNFLAQGFTTNRVPIWGHKTIQAIRRVAELRNVAPESLIPSPLGIGRRAASITCVECGNETPGRRKLCSDECKTLFYSRLMRQTNLRKAESRRSSQ